MLIESIQQLEHLQRSLIQVPYDSKTTYVWLHHICIDFFDQVRIDLNPFLLAKTSQDFSGPTAAYIANQSSKVLFWHPVTLQSFNLYTTAPFWQITKSRVFYIS